MSDASPLSALLERAKALVRQRQFAAAIDLFQQACELDPDCVEAHEAMAQTYAMSGNLESAIQQFKQVTLLAPRKATAYVNLGALYNSTGDYQKAIEMCRKAVQIDRKSADGFYNLGIAHRKLNQLPLALPAYREAIRINPQMIVAHQNLGNVFLDMGNAREAISHFKKALEIDPEFVKAKVGLEKAELLKVQGKVTTSPFGRLVNEAELSTKQATLDTSRLRELTDEERHEDHHMIQILNRGIARASREMRDQLQKGLVPEIKELDRSVGSNASFQETIRKFKPIAVQFQTACRKLEAAVNDLRDYEERILEKLRK